MCICEPLTSLACTIDQTPFIAFPEIGGTGVFLCFLAKTTGLDLMQKATFPGPHLKSVMRLLLLVMTLVTPLLLLLSRN